MASKQDKQTAEETNDWNQSDDDDNWDDWGDGDDDDGKFVHVEKQPDENSAKAIKEKAKVVIADDVARDEAAVPPNTSASSTSNSSASSGWGLWGGKLSSVLSTASEGLGNITTHVNQGLNQIIGVPDPEELARLNAAEAAANPATASTTADEEEEETRAARQENASAGAAFNLGMVTTLGSKVLNTGLDTLEGIGKKTMTILQDNDPKLMNKRKLLGLDASSGPNLSAILLEAKKDADQMEQTMQQLQLEKQKAQLRFDVLFENYCGLVHYEALEILSKESRLKLDTLLDAVSGRALSELQETIGEVRELLELEDLECDSEGDYTPAELNERLSATIADAELGIKFDDVTSHWSKSLSWLDSEEATAADLEQAYARSINALSEACALEMCKLHKIAELMLVKPHHSTANEVDGIVHLCKQFNGHLQGLTQRHAALLSSKSNEQDADHREEGKARVNTYFAEMLTAVKYIEQAYNLFTPILQMGAV
ncbi:protein FAM114A2 [Drosophila grimshawi]|uniref:GH18219 n=1 Tax=Drosophila grimshawi TaxID=7222 RepID=B4JFS2_DROGR|nr:protein FAM114A2 [Drosophila grimshawi]EDV93553.1 GH18219 [Drosophila grimshawi]